MSLKICIPVRAHTLNDFLKKITKASAQADIVELWLGDLQPTEVNFEKIFALKKTPYLLTMKGEKEHGSFRGIDAEKLTILLDGAQRGAEYIDLDHEFPEELIKKCVQEKKKANLLLSAHFFEGTPTLPSLLNRIKKMQSLGADIVKIASMANSEKDLITILRLSENLQRQDQKFIAIAMGKLGKVSRIATPLLGGEMMFASLNKREITAEGQMTAEEMRKVWEILQN